MIWVYELRTHPGIQYAQFTILVSYLVENGD